MIKVALVLKKRETPIPELKQLRHAVDELKKALMESYIGKSIYWLINRLMKKKNNFWFGFIVGCVVMFLYGWLSIWATYTSLERADRERTEELEAIKRIIYFSEDIQSQYKESVDWNEQNMISMPEWATEPEGDGNE